MKLEMSNQVYSAEQLKRAKKYTKRLKSWYWLITMNLLISATFVAISYLMHANGEPNTIVWILMSSPLALWIIFIVEGIVLNKSKTVSSWEERQMKKYMSEE